MKYATECHTMKEVFSFVSTYLLIGGQSATYAVVTEPGLRNTRVLVCRPQLSDTQIVGASRQQFITSVTVTLISLIWCNPMCTTHVGAYFEHSQEGR
jgi:hypothetical protein